MPNLLVQIFVECKQSRWQRLKPAPVGATIHSVMFKSIVVAVSAWKTDRNIPVLGADRGYRFYNGRVV